MSEQARRAADELNRRFFLDYPGDAALEIEQLGGDRVVEIAQRQSVKTLAPVWSRLLSPTAARLLEAFPNDIADGIIGELPPPEAARILAQYRQTDRTTRLARLDPVIAEELEALLSYPPDSAGRLMDSAALVFRSEATAGATLIQLRGLSQRPTGSILLVDGSHVLTGQVRVIDIALADPSIQLSALQIPVAATVQPMDPVENVADSFESGEILELPVCDVSGVLLGVIAHDDLTQTLQEDATVSIQTMVGASREERALSTPIFAVCKRMPWLQINLLTAFLAASIVGLFQETIAQVTALAVLLPIVAGQSGNAGAQALAITMRGLALREISVRQWAKIVRKEMLAGLLNGICIALTCGFGVYLWSQSIGLVAVISLSMIVSMIIAGLAGALTPIVLRRLGQDPATSSSIILTTITEIFGFLSFLGIGAMMIQFL